ncbi:MAG TPA: fibronectin type III-like domain-contianing protein, partial [Terriglobia bacterium]|nr:fibronectin type III-like domain-contianing protein [Terriglobia bacterium]
RNDGKHAGEETLFLFIHDKVASVARPLLELRAFGRIRLRPGEMATLTLRVPASQLRFLGADLTPVFEPGEVEVFAGPSAERSQLLGAVIRLRG